MACNLLKLHGAGDGTRTRDVQLGKMAFEKGAVSGSR
jgi:hypothetical protein